MIKILFKLNYTEVEMAALMKSRGLSKKTQLNRKKI